MAALQYVDIPGYSAILFRRTLSELKLSGALLDRAHSWLSGKRCSYVASEHTYYFPTVSPWGGYGEPAKIAFGYMGQESAKARYQSAEYQFCVATGTKVILADGSKKPIEKVQVGDYVFTPQGSRLVTKKHGPKLKPCVRMGGQVQGISHRVLTSSGWVSYADLLRNQCGPYSTTRSRVSRTGFSHSQRKSQSAKQTLDNQSSYPLQPLEFVSKHVANSVLSQEIYELLTDVETYCATSGGLHPEFQQLPELFARVRLVSLSSRVDQRETHPDGGSSCVFFESSVRGYQDDYFGHPYQRDEQFQAMSLTSRFYLREPYGAGTSSRSRGNSGVEGCTPERNPVCLSRYTHPYTMEGRHSDLIEDDQLFSFQPCGLSEVWDLTVQGESQYVSSYTDVKCISNSNCGFDELTHYPENDYLWMFSRLRKVTCSRHPKLDHEGSPIYEPGCPECEQKRMVPIRLRGASNPGNIGHKWVKERFRIEPVQRNGEVVYIGNHPERPFIPATVTDNQYVDQKAYIEGLNELDPLTRAQMKKGDWGASLDARYKAQWFSDRRYYRRGDYYVLGARAQGFLRSAFIKVFTVIDPAASGREGPGDMDRFKKPGKSWTVLTTFGLTDDYNLLILDMVRVYVEAPEILRLAKNVFKAQRPSYMICEAAGVGKAVYQALNKAGLPVKPIHPHQDKVMRATDALIRAEKGQIWLPAHPGPAWLRDMEEELFTWIGHPHETDDIIDTISYAATDVSWEASGDERSNDPDLPEDSISSEFGPSVFENTSISQEYAPEYHNPNDYYNRC